MQGLACVVCFAVVPLLIGHGSLAVSVVFLTFSGLKTVLQGRIHFGFDFLMSQANLMSQVTVSHERSARDSSIVICRAIILRVFFMFCDLAKQIVCAFDVEG